MQIKLLYELATKIVGKPGEKIINILYNKKNVNEFKIAKKMGMTVNQVRNLLYRFHDHNIISFIRKKDRKKSWYIYYWTINNLNMLENLLKMKIKEKEDLKNQLRKKSKTFYSCKHGCVEMSEETALNYNFLCPECNELLQPINQKELFKQINSKINKIDKEIEIIKGELDKEKLKIEKKREIKSEGKKLRKRKIKKKIKKRKLKKKIRKTKRRKKMKKQKRKKRK